MGWGGEMLLKCKDLNISLREFCEPGNDEGGMKEFCGLG